jgi:hypothetical protein
MIPLLLLAKLRALPWRWIGVLALLAVTFATGWNVANWRRDSMELAVTLAAEKAGQSAITAAVDAIEGIQVKYVTIKQQAEVVTREVPVYRDCVHDPRGLSAINTALAGGEPRSGTAGVSDAY